MFDIALTLQMLLLEYHLTITRLSLTLLYLTRLNIVLTLQMILPEDIPTITTLIIPCLMLCYLCLVLLCILMHYYYTWLDYTIPLRNTTARNQCLTYISIASIKLFYNVYYTKNRCLILTWLFYLFFLIFLLYTQKIHH